MGPDEHFRSPEPEWDYLHPRVTFIPRNLVLELCVQLAERVPGNIVEFGVAEGHSTRVLRRASRRSGEPMFACDSFKGLPEKFENAEKGTFACEPPRIAGVEIVAGYFEESLTDDLAKKVGRVALASLDADLYSSTICALRWLTPLLSAGSILVFDEFLGAGVSDRFQRSSARSFTADARAPPGLPSRKVNPTRAPASSEPELAMIEVFNHIRKRIEDSRIEHVPLPHLVIAKIFPANSYSVLLQAMPKADQFVSAKYPGTGFGKAKSGERNSPGLVFPDISGVPLLGALQRFLQGDEFCRALLNKFSIPAALGKNTGTSPTVHETSLLYSICRSTDVATKSCLTQTYRPKS